MMIQLNKISDRINHKHTQIVCNSFYFRYNFIHKDPIFDIYEITALPPLDDITIELKQKSVKKSDQFSLIQPAKA